MLDSSNKMCRNARSYGTSVFLKIYCRDITLNHCALAVSRVVEFRRFYCMVWVKKKRERERESGRERERERERDFCGWFLPGLLCLLRSLTFPQLKEQSDKFEQCSHALFISQITKPARHFAPTSFLLAKYIPCSFILAYAHTTHSCTLYNPLSVFVLPLFVFEV